MDQIFQEIHPFQEGTHHLLHEHIAEHFQCPRMLRRMKGTGDGKLKEVIHTPEPTEGEKWVHNCIGNMFSPAC